VHQAPRVGVELFPAVHGAAIVPYDQVADLPLVHPGERGIERMRPKRVEEFFAIGDRQPRDVGVRAAAEVQRLAPGFRMGVRTMGWIAPG